MSPGMRCPACKEEHSDYDRVGKYTVSGPHHAGVVEVAECGRCGTEIEVCRR